MNAEYRLVHFVPNPIAGARVLVAALVRAGDLVKVVRPNSIPDAECLGSRRAATLLHAVRPCLERLESFSSLPAELGPLFVLGQVQELPATAEDPIAALERLLFPPVGQAPQVRGPKRSTLGRNWLVRNGVAEEAIGKRFRPEILGLRAHAKAVTHYVRGANGLLLMEPISAMQNLHDLREQIDTAATRLRATDHILSEVGYAEERAFVTYVLPGGPSDALGLAREAMGFENGAVVDCGARAEAEAFTARINRLAGPLGLN